MYQINTIADNVNSNKTQSFTYDSKSQLIKAIGDYGQYDFTLDEVGNRLSKTIDMINLESYTVDPLSNRLLSIDKGAENRTLSYDLNGNVTHDKGYDNVSKILTYGDNNRLIDVDGFTYGYNPMEQRVIDNGKINNYDLSGQLISVNDNGNIIEYIYLGNAKIAMLVDNGDELKTYYAHNNYMNMPRLFTDEYKNVVWSGDFTPFGELYNENGSVNNVIRFSGQYENLESGYFYNYHRDYDAGLGRYLQSDPIGLNGGINTYAYVLGNPINFTDPLGMKLYVSDGIDKALNKLANKHSIFKKMRNYLEESSNLYYIGDQVGWFDEKISEIGKVENQEEYDIVDALKEAMSDPIESTFLEGKGIGALACGSYGESSMEEVLSHELMHFFDHAIGKRDKMKKYEREKRAQMLRTYYTGKTYKKYRGKNITGYSDRGFKEDLKKYLK